MKRGNHSLKPRHTAPASHPECPRVGLCLPQLCTTLGNNLIHLGDNWEVLFQQFYFPLGFLFCLGGSVWVWFGVFYFVFYFFSLHTINLGRKKNKQIENTPFLFLLPQSSRVTQAKPGRETASKWAAMISMQGSQRSWKSDKSWSSLGWKDL